MTRVAVVIPSYGRIEMTQRTVRALYQEKAVHVVVVDNGGDYQSVADEQVVLPRENLGWLRGTNVGLQAAMTTKAYSHYMLLNNDVVLSHGFVQGMVAAQLETGAGIVAPCYDDVYEVQRKHYVGPAEEYVSVLSEESTDLVDGTCMLIPDDPLRQVGLLDERFHKFGWGGADDLCLRMRRLGHSIVVTRRSYLQHFAGATARVVDPGYRPLAAAELYLGMKAKYGRRWMDEFPGGAFAHHGRYEAWLHRKNRALAVLRTRRRVER